MFEERCQNLENLPLQYAWNKHCGGGAWEFTSRSLTLAGSFALAFAGTGIMFGGGPVGVAVGGSLIFKSGNDAYEALSGNRSYARNTMGDPLYDAIDVALIGYGFFRRVAKINYLGNPKRDLFVRDPLTYESAFKQFSTLEGLHMIGSTVVTGQDSYKKYAGRLNLEEAWDKHLRGVQIDYD